MSGYPHLSCLLYMLLLSAPPVECACIRLLLRVYVCWRSEVTTLLTYSTKPNKAIWQLKRSCISSKYMSSWQYACCCMPRLQPATWARMRLPRAYVCMLPLSMLVRMHAGPHSAALPVLANENTWNRKHLLQHTPETCETFEIYLCNICV
jgi:hypothetical protein